MSISQNVETPSGVFTAALVSIAGHIAEHRLPFPRDIYVAQDGGGRSILRVLASGAGDQMRWLNTVTIATQHQEPAGPGRFRMAWRVHLPDGTGFELVGFREGDHPHLVEVAAPVEVPACAEEVR